MLRFIRHGERWFAGGIVAFIAVVFIFMFGPWDLRARDEGAVPIQVGNVQITRNDFLRQRQQLEENYRSVLGDNFDPKAASAQLDAMTANGMIDNVLLSAEAERLGLSVSDEEIDSWIRSLAETNNMRDADGRLDEERLRNNVIREYGTVRQFKEAVRRDLLAGKMRRVFASGAQVSEREARDAILYKKQEIQIAYVALDPKDAPGQAQISEGDVEESLRQNETRARDFYLEHKDRFEKPERFRVRQVLIAVEEDADDDAKAEKRKQAEAVLERIRGGEDMAAVAREKSDDLGSKEEGGDLGLVPRADLLDEVAKAVNELPVSEVSEVIESNRGFHVVRLEERRAAGPEIFEAVSLEIAKELLEEERGLAYADEMAEQLAAGIREGRSLEEVARELKVSIERTGFFRRRYDGYIPGLGSSREAQSTAFALSLEAPSSSAIFEVDNKRALVQLLDRKEPTDEEISEDLEGERERLARQKQQEIQAAWMGTRRQELEEAGELQLNLDAVR